MRRVLHASLESTATRCTHVCAPNIPLHEDSLWESSARLGSRGVRATIEGSTMTFDIDGQACQFTARDLGSNEPTSPRPCLSYNLYGKTLMYRYFKIPNIGTST